MRRERLEVYERETPALMSWTDFFSFSSTVFNAFVVLVSRYLPMRAKNRLLELTGADIGENVAIGFEATLDIFRPGLISIGRGSTIGYDATLLAHETTQDEFRIGEVAIGENVLVGAGTIVLPGVRIGDGAKISANSLVNRDVEEGEFVGGVPVRNLEDGEGRER